MGGSIWDFTWPFGRRGSRLGFCLVTKCHRSHSMNINPWNIDRLGFFIQLVCYACTFVQFTFVQVHLFIHSFIHTMYYVLNTVNYDLKMIIFATITLSSKHASHLPENIPDCPAQTASESLWKMGKFILANLPILQKVLEAVWPGLWYVWNILIPEGPYFDLCGG